MKRLLCSSGLQKISGLLGVVITAAMTVGGYFVGRASQPTATSWSIPGVTLDATATDSGDEFAIATGPISDEVEGLFVLDYATGLLQCHVLYPRAGQMGALLQANVKDSLPGDVAKGVSKYLMVTGHANFPGGAAGPASTVVYVLDTVSGGFVCYGVPFNRSAMNSGTPLQLPLRVIASGTARAVPDRSRR